MVSIIAVSGFSKVLGLHTSGTNGLRYLRMSERDSVWEQEKLVARKMHIHRTESPPSTARCVG